MTTYLVQAPLSLISLGIALLVAIALAAATIGGSIAEPDPDASPTQPARPSAEASSDPESEEDELLDYERTPIPAAVLQQPGGRLITLTQLTAQRAALLVFVTEGCGPCERVLDHAEEWIGDLESTLQVRFVFSRPLDQLRERTMQRVEGHALHDLQFTARTALGGSGAPSAVLLGADGQLAGGPVSGGSDVIEFVQEIREQLAEAQGAGAQDAPA